MGMEKITFGWYLKKILWIFMLLLEVYIYKIEKIKLKITKEET